MQSVEGSRRFSIRCPAGDGDGEEWTLPASPTQAHSALPQARYKQKWQPLAKRVYPVPVCQAGAAFGDTIRWQAPGIPPTPVNQAGRDRKRDQQQQHSLYYGLQCPAHISDMYHSNVKSLVSRSDSAFMLVNHRVKVQLCARVVDPCLGRPFLSCVSTSSNKPP